MKIIQKHPSSNRNFWFKFYLLSLIAIGFQTSFVAAQCPPIAPQTIITGSVSWTGVTIQYDGDVRITSGSSLMIQNSSVTFNEGVRLIVEPNASLTIDQSSLSNACSNMWRGVEAQSNSSIKLSNTTVRNAEYGINVGDKVWLGVLDCSFQSNFIGINLFPNPSGYSFSTFYVTGTEFHCTSPLIGSYPGQSTIAGVQSYAGIVLNNCNVSIDGGVNANRFYELNNGIVSNASYLIVKNSTFDSVLPDPVYGNIYDGSGIAAFSSGATLAALYQTGYGASPSSPVSYKKCRYGIYLDGIHATITDNFMQDMTTGIRVVKSDNRSVVLSNMLIYCSEYGVESIFNEYATLFRVSWISVYLDNLSGVPGSGAGIYHAEYGTSSAGTVSITDCYVEVAVGQYGIQLNNSIKVNLYRNTVYGQHPLLIYQGIAVTGGKLNKLNCNSVDMGGVLDLPKSRTDFYISSSEMNQIECNTAFNGGIGFLVEGFSSTPGGFFNNTMQDNGYTGIQLESNAVLGIQTNADNNWIGSFSGSGGHEAINLGIVSPSRFNGNFLDPFWPSAPIPPSGWFVNNNGSFGAVCGCPQAIPPGEGEGYGYQAALNESSGMDSYFNSETNPYDLALKYQYDKFVYTSYLDSSSISHALFSDLIDSLSTTSVSSIIEYDRSVAASKLFDLSDLELLSEYGAFRDSLVSVTASLESRCATIQHCPASLLDSISVLNDQIRSLSMMLDYLDSAKTIAEVSVAQIAENALIQLESEGSNLVLWDQSISSIYSKLTQTGFNELNTSDITTLYDIAAMCPMLGGDLVFRARSILNLFYPGLVYEDSLACTGIGLDYRRSKNAEVDFIISPNPVHDLLRLKFTSTILEGAVFITVHSSDGIPFRKIDGYGYFNSVDIKLDDLLPGIYFIEVVDASGYLLGRSKFIKI